MDRNALENKGWGQMESLLNEHMPQKKKRRGLLWLWLSGSVGLMIMLTLLLSQNTESSQPESIVKNEIVNTESKQVNPINTTDNTQPNTENSINNTNSPVHEQATLNDESVSIIKNQSPKPVKSEASKEPFLILNTDQDQDRNIPLESIDQSENLPIISLPIPLKVDSSNISNLPRASLEQNPGKQEILKPIYVNSFAFETEPPKWKNFYTDPVSLSQHSKKWSWGLDLNAIAGHQELSAIGLGLFASKSVHPNLDLSFGIGYQYVKPNELLLNGLARSFSEQEDALTPMEMDTSVFPGAILEADQDFSLLPIEQVSDLLNEAHVLSFEVGLDYKFHRKWSVGSQVGWSRYYFKRIQVFEQTVTFNSVDLVPADNLTNRTAFHLSGHLSFHFSPRWNVYAGYHRSLNNLIKNDFQSTENREGLSGIQVGTRIKF